ncbi:DNA polymerase III subunit delta [Sodalis sp. CWE]|uniref:DNA polymerase III subunit delta n=1 Tax=Sodalis sp. CWE TaxID=2803816 RepID=UPI001C7D43F9|nr:DNA polymerase III subunit delta [Sodalis sp. CWE]MBX4180929.1 DNA polymerase III subunit delta [Sodalis sp. CWE]
MIQLNAEQLDIQLHDVSGISCFLLFGNDLFLIQESQLYIQKLARLQQFKEHFNFSIETNTDWIKIFNLFQIRSLFSDRRTVLLALPEVSINSCINRELFNLVSMLHKDIILIISGNKLNQSLKGSAWFRTIKKSALLVDCNTPEQICLLQWIEKRARSMGLILDDASFQLLSDSYEGNLLGLNQALNQLAILYPKKDITFFQVQKSINNDVRFTLLLWIETILIGNRQRAMRILYQLKLEVIDPVILLHSIQREILLLFKISRKKNTEPLSLLYNHYRVWSRRRLFLTKALERLSTEQLYNAIMLITEMEIMLKQDYNYPIWNDLNILILLLCEKSSYYYQKWQH